MNDQNPFQQSLSELKKNENSAQNQNGTPLNSQTSEPKKNRTFNRSTFLIALGFIAVTALSAGATYLKSGAFFQGNLSKINIDESSQQTEENGDFTLQSGTANNQTVELSTTNSGETLQPGTVGSETVELTTVNNAGTLQAGTINNSSIELSTANSEVVLSSGTENVATSQLTEIQVENNNCDQIQKEIESIQQKMTVETDAQIKKDFQEQIDQLQQRAFISECKIVVSTLPGTINLKCASGQIGDSEGQQCVCDSSNGYYSVKIQNTFATAISTTPSNLMCLSCNQITQRLTEIDKNSTGSMSNISSQIIHEKSVLVEAAQQNNCNICASFDDRIKSALHEQKWMDYYQAINAKNDDNMCGLKLNTCDSLKWKLIFTMQLKSKVESSSIVDHLLLDQLNQKIKELRSQVLQNACVDVRQACTSILANSSSIALNNTNSPGDIDLDSVTPGQLFYGDRAFKEIQCRGMKIKGFKRAVKQTESPQTVSDMHKF